MIRLISVLLSVISTSKVHAIDSHTVESKAEVGEQGQLPTCSPQGANFSKKLEDLNQVLAGSYSMQPLKIDAIKAALGSYEFALSKSFRRNLRHALRCDQMMDGCVFRVEGKSIPAILLDCSSYTFPLTQGRTLTPFNPKCEQEAACKEGNPFDSHWNRVSLTPEVRAEKVLVPIPSHLKQQYPDYDLENYTYALTLEIPRQGLRQTLEYFSAGQDPGFFSRRLKKVAGTAADKGVLRIPLQELLPPMAAKRQAMFPTHEILDGDDGPNCYASVRAFYKKDVERWSSSGTSRNCLDCLLMKHYCEIEDDQAAKQDFRFGDIVVDREDGGHAVRVLFKDQAGTIWVHSKPSGADTKPWKIVPLKEAFKGRLPAGDPFSRLFLYRRCK